MTACGLETESYILKVNKGRTTVWRILFTKTPEEIIYFNAIE